MADGEALLSKIAYKEAESFSQTEIDAGLVYYQQVKYDNSNQNRLNFITGVCAESFYLLNNGSCLFFA